MRANPIAPWELRVGSLRVYYEVSDAEHLVLIRAIGIKDRDRVRVAGEEIDL
jgi:mRNA-degrading endonuclease RelE of RelBE toxin-antitoxin system